MKRKALVSALILIVSAVLMFGGVVTSTAVGVVPPPPQPAMLNLPTNSPGTATWFGLTGQWSNQDVSIMATPTLSSFTTSTLIPVGYLAYSKDGGPVVDITSSMVQKFTQEGVYAFDARGSLLTTSFENTSTFIRIDKTRPVSHSDAVRVYDNTATVAITATDALSGATFVVYSLSNGVQDFAGPGWTPYTGPGNTVTTVTVTTPGWNHLSWFSIDRAGNHELRQSVDFLVNPMGYVPLLGKPAVSPRSKHRLKMSGSVTPAATARPLMLTVQRRGAGGKFKNFMTLGIMMPKFAGSYSVTWPSLSKGGTFRVRASEGAGSSVWSRSVAVP